MTANNHRGRVYHSLKDLLAQCDGSDSAVRAVTAVWKRHVERNGNVPLVDKCYVCSGRERRREIKCGAHKPGRPTKRERDEQRGLES